MKKLAHILPILFTLTAIAAAQTSGVISYPVNGEVIGGTYASQGTASSMTSVIPPFASTTATLSMSSTTIAVASAAGIVNGELVISSNIPAGTKVVSISGLNVVLSATPTTAGSAVAVTFASVYLNFDGLNFDGGPGCGVYRSLSITGAGTASASYYAPIYAGSGEWAATSHTIPLTVVDSMGVISTTGNTNVTVYNSSPAGIGLTIPGTTNLTLNCPVTVS